MNRKFSNVLCVLQLTTGIALMGLAGCAHKVTPVSMSAESTPSAEIANQVALMNQALSAQVDVLANDDFTKAVSHLSDAQKQNKKGESSDKIMKNIGYSRAYLNKATEVANMVKTSIVQITDARTAALVAGARSLPKELANLDDKLKDMTDDAKDIGKISSGEKAELQSLYLNLELSAIKFKNLNEAKNILSLVKKKGAEKITPTAYKQALEKMNIAEKTIETDRHISAKINPAVQAALASSQRVLKLLESEQNSRNQTPEQRAMTLETRDNAVLAAKVETSEVVAVSNIKDKQLQVQDETITVQGQYISAQGETLATQSETLTTQGETLATQSETLAAQGATIAVAEGENREHMRKEQEDKMVNLAAAQFEKSEAEVYRQDGNLVIRLKKMNFANNRSDLPTESLPVLTKVKEIIKGLSAESFVVEGHTDAVGSATKNQTLSEKRAKSVAQFFITDKVLADKKIESMGFGYAKPLSTNKTKEGRAQNRRVDIIIKTNSTIQL